MEVVVEYPDYRDLDITVEEMDISKDISITQKTDWVQLPKERIPNLINALKKVAGLE